MEWVVTKNGMFLHMLFPLMHLKGKSACKPGNTCGFVSVRAGTAKQDRPENASMVVLSTASTSLSRVLSATIFLGRYLLSFFNLCGLRVIYLLILWMKYVFTFKCNLMWTWGCSRVVIFWNPSKHGVGNL